MALTIQGVIDDVSYETGLLLDGTAGSGDAFTLLQRWVSQIQQDLLHNGVFRHALRRTTTVTSVAGTRSYGLTPTNVHRVDAVYDEQHEQFLSPISELFPPSQTADVKDKQPGAPRPETALAAHRASTPYPQWYWLDTTVTTGTNAHTLHLFPPPKNAENAGTIRILYTMQQGSVTGASTNLSVGEDGRTAIVAGVTARALAYLGYAALAQEWQQKYERLKLGELI